MEHSNINPSDSNSVVVKIQFDVVASTSGELRERLRELVAHGANSIVLDFSEVRIVDSAGLGMIIAAHNSLRKVAGELILTNCSPDVLDLFRSMRIHQHMKIEGAGVATA